MLAKNRDKPGLYIGKLAFPIALNAYPLYSPPLIEMGLFVYRNVVLSLTGNYACLTTDAFVNVDGHAPFFVRHNTSPYFALLQAALACALELRVGPCYLNDVVIFIYRQVGGRVFELRNPHPLARLIYAHLGASPSQRTSIFIGEWRKYREDV